MTRMYSTGDPEADRTAASSLFELAARLKGEKVAPPKVQRKLEAEKGCGLVNERVVAAAMKVMQSFATAVSLSCYWRIPEKLRKSRLCFFASLHFSDGAR